MTVTRVAICSRAATPHEGVLKARLKRLRGRIESEGLGLFASADDREAFLDALPDGPEAQAWERLITDLRLLHVLDEVRSVHEYRARDELKGKFAEHADVIVCGVEHGRELGLAQDEPVDQGPPAVAPLEYLDLVEAFTTARTNLEIPALTPRIDVWEGRFRRLAQFVEKLTIVDRYAFENQKAAAQKETGFKWLIERVLDARGSMGPLKLEIVVSRVRTGGTLEQQLVRAIDAFQLRRPDPERFRRISLYLADKEFAARNLHDRFIRFDGRVVNVTTGLQVFSDESLFQRCTASVGSFSDSEARMELVEANCLGADWRASSQMWKWRPDGPRVRFATEGGA